MNRDRIVAAAVAAAVAVGLVVTVRPADLGERPVDSRIHRKSESKLLELEDGGKGYGYPTEVCTDGGIRYDEVGALPDGGPKLLEVHVPPSCVTEYVVTSTAPCVRALPDAGECWRRERDGGATFFGWLNRFPAEEAVGNGCQPVACSVVMGEDADEDEDVRLQRERGRRGQP